MPSKQAEKLKLEGNDLFKSGHFDDAIQKYEKAIQEERSQGNDQQFLALLLSNMAQGYLKLEKYGDALEQADKSIQIDATNKKSLFRRGLAYLELGQKSKAASDLRLVLKSEPRNQMAIDNFRKACPRSKASDLFRRAVFSHKFRSFLLNYRHTFDPRLVDNSCYIGITFLKMTFLSKACAETMRFFVDGLQVSPTLADLSLPIMISFTCPQMAKCLKHDLHQTKPAILIHIEHLKPLSAAIPSPNFTMHFETVEFVPQFLSICEFRRVICKKTTIDVQNETNEQQAQILKQYAPILTDLPYFHKFMQFLGDVKFPRLHAIHCNGEDPMKPDFLKHWQRSNWDIKQLIFYPFTPNLSTFTAFNEPISTTVTEVFLPLDDGERTTDSAHLQTVTGKLQVLKRAFPSLQQITVTLQLYSDCLEFISSLDLYRNVYEFITQIDENLCVPWCTRPQFQLSHILSVSTAVDQAPIRYQLTEMLRKVVKKLRVKLHANLRYINSPRPVVKDYGYIKGGLCFALVEIGTQKSDFQVYFEVKKVSQ